MIENPAKEFCAPSHQEVRELLVTLLHEIGGFAPSVLSRNPSLDHELQMRSATLVEIQVAIEDELGVEVDLLEILELNRLDSIIDYLALLATR